MPVPHQGQAPEGQLELALDIVDVDATVPGIPLAPPEARGRLGLDRPDGRVGCGGSCDHLPAG